MWPDQKKVPRSISISDITGATPTAESDRKPRIAIMGEFSSGKSTLCNLLIGSNPLPVKVTATQLPPVWMAHGDQAPYREDLDGQTHPVDLDRLEDIALDDTTVIRIFLQADILEMCDIIEMPGISDPNMAPEIWERVLHHADAVLWCTHATQAWRQSEAAVWKSLPQSLFAKSYLLITRIDKLLSERDRRKVLKRVRRETEGLFAGLFPISLTQAMGAQDDGEQWENSGAEEFSAKLIDLIDQTAATLDRPKRPLLRQLAEPSGADAQSKVFHLENPIQPVTPSQVRITPSRVRAPTAAGSAALRPGRPNQPPASP